MDINIDDPNEVRKRQALTAFVALQLTLHGFHLTPSELETLSAEELKVAQTYLSNKDIHALGVQPFFLHLLMKNQGLPDVDIEEISAIPLEKRMEFWNEIYQAAQEGIRKETKQAQAWVGIRNMLLTIPFFVLYVVWDLTAPHPLNTINGLYNYFDNRGSISIGFSQVVLPFAASILASAAAFLFLFFLAKRAKLGDQL